MKRSLWTALGLITSAFILNGLLNLRSDASYAPCTNSSVPCIYLLQDYTSTNQANINSSHQLAIQAPPSLPLPSGAMQQTGGSVQPIAASSGGMSVFNKQVANNTTSFAVDASAGTLYGISAFNNSATIAYIKLFNTAQGSVTCGSGTVVDRMMIPANSNGTGFIWSLSLGVAYSTAITACVTTGFADSDTSAPAASTYEIGFYYK